MFGYDHLLPIPFLLFYLSFFFGRIVWTLYVIHSLWNIGGLLTYVSTVSPLLPVFCQVTPILFLVLNTFWFIQINIEAVSQLKKTNKKKPD